MNNSNSASKTKNAAVVPFPVDSAQLSSINLQLSPTGGSLECAKASMLPPNGLSFPKFSVPSVSSCSKSVSICVHLWLNRPQPLQNPNVSRDFQDFSEVFRN